MEFGCDTWDLRTDYTASSSSNVAHPWNPDHSYHEYNINGGLKVDTDVSGNTCSIEGQEFSSCYSMVPQATDTDQYPLGLAQLWFHLNFTYPYVDCQAQFKAFIGLSDDPSCGTTGAAKNCLL